MANTTAAATFAQGSFVFPQRVANTTASVRCWYSAVNTGAQANTTAIMANNRKPRQLSTSSQPPAYPYSTGLGTLS